VFAADLPNDAGQQLDVGADVLENLAGRVDDWMRQRRLELVCAGVKRVDLLVGPAQAGRHGQQMTQGDPVLGGFTEVLAGREEVKNRCVEILDHPLVAGYSHQQRTDTLGHRGETVPGLSREAVKVLLHY